MHNVDGLVLAFEFKNFSGWSWDFARHNKYIFIIGEANPAPARQACCKPQCCLFVFLLLSSSCLVLIVFILGFPSLSTNNLKCFWVCTFYNFIFIKNFFVNVINITIVILREKNKFIKWFPDNKAFLYNIKSWNVLHDYCTIFFIKTTYISFFCIIYLWKYNIFLRNHAILCVVLILPLDWREQCHQ